MISNESGFVAVPGGLRFINDGTFGMIGERAQFWSSTENDSDRGAIIMIGISHEASIDIAGKGFGYSVRCVKG